jgi:hypothetical protein
MSTDNPGYEPPITQDAVSSALVGKAQRFRRSILFDRRFGRPILVTALLLLAFAIFGLRPSIVAFENWQADRAIAAGDMNAATEHEATAWAYQHSASKKLVFFLMFLPVGFTNEQPDKARCTEALKTQQAMLDLNPPTLMRTSFYSAWAICEEQSGHSDRAYADYVAGVKSANTTADTQHLAFGLLTSANNAARYRDPSTARRLIDYARQVDPKLVGLVVQKSARVPELFPSLAPIFANKE